MNNNEQLLREQLKKQIQNEFEQTLCHWTTHQENEELEKRLKQTHANNNKQQHH